MSSTVKIEKFSLDELVRGVMKSELGSISTVVSRLLTMLGDKSTNAVDLMKVIEADPVLASRLLRRVNSAAYGLNRTISSIQESIVMIGFGGVKELALNLKVAKLFEHGLKSDIYSRIGLWKHSFAVATVSKLIYRREFKERGDDAYSTGLLHDIGIIAEEQIMPEAFELMLKKVSRPQTLISAEADTFGYDHQLVGSRLCSTWKLPPDMSEVISRHHSIPDESKPTARMSMVLHLADHLCSKAGLGFEHSADATDDGIIPLCSKLRISHDSAKLILADVKREIDELEASGGLLG